MKIPFYILSVLLLTPTVSFSADKVDFTRDIRPILSGRCFKCHGPDEETRESGLRLDTHKGAISELDSGETGIVPKHPEKSSIIDRVTIDDPDLRMPPLSEGKGLTKQEIDLLKRWISEGAEYKVHWSFTPPVRPQLPRVSNPAWCNNAIDYFTLAHLDNEKRLPSPEADRYTLARRLSIDLIGLPPSIETVDEFVSDKSPDAYERYVDRLLASPAFGERWGRVWLDLARYADTSGYADDPPRVIWRYRDWVISALNDNMPFDQFTRDQLAGDLLNSPTDDQLIATAFHRNTMTNSEGGTDDEEFRTAAIVDRVNTTMQTWMGLTMACAQCHTHKYDPITQEDYFRVYAILNQTADADRRDESPTLDRYTSEQMTRREQLQSRIAELKKKRDALAEKEAPAQTETPSKELNTNIVRIVLPGKDKFLSLAEVQVFVGEENVARKGKAKQISTAYDGPAKLAIDGITNGHFFEAKSTTHTDKETNPWWEVDLGSAHRIEKVTIWNRNDAPGIGQRLNGFEVILLDAKRNPLWASKIAKASDKATEIAIPQSTDKFTKEDKATLARHLVLQSPELAKIETEIKNVEKQLAGIRPVRTPIYQELPAEKQRKTFIQIRGNFLDLGQEVTAGFPDYFAKTEVKKPTRKELADWITADTNPLTARVIVNRHWEQLFGIGLVDTSEDFGMQGNLPSHPQLLDWLAYEFQHGNGSTGKWDVKQMLRTVVTSATYRQSSDASSELVAIDPMNRLLARGPRYRLSAERIRDQALFVSGLLSQKMLGPSVKPPRPNLGLRAAFGGSTDWSVSSGEDKYRRGLYTYWQRTIPYPSMDTFDAPSREVCTVRRIRTNTPLQALVTLNDPVFVEAAAGVAIRTMEAKSKLEDRIIYAFRLCVSRPPSKTELQTIKATYNKAFEYFQSHPELAINLANSHVNSTQNKSELAAWTLIGNILLNLDEALARR